MDNNLTARESVMNNKLLSRTTLVALVVIISALFLLGPCYMLDRLL